MNFLRNKLQRFFYGRYGLDQMYYGLLGLYVILFLLQVLLDWEILHAVCGLLLVYALWRTLSKNHAARRRENQVFLKLWEPTKTELILLRDRFRDRKNARYRHCKHCHAILKLPNKRGSHTVICPKCHKRFSVYILF